MGKITEKNKEFVQEYLLTGNATKSYMKIYKNENETIKIVQCGSHYRDK